MSPANTLIENQASVTYLEAGKEVTALSNIVSFNVLEIVDHSIITNHSNGVQGTSPGLNEVLSFTLKNTGNGTDKYLLSLSQDTADDFNAINPKIYLDKDGDGLFDVTVDEIYSPGVNDPELPLGGDIEVFIVSDLPGGLAQDDKANLTISATSSVGTGLMGTLFPGAGDDGIDAVLGASGGFAESISFYFVSSMTIEVKKSQSIISPTGGAQATKGSIITYSLAVEITGTGVYSASTLEDAIPAGTTYVPGSLVFEATAMTDAADADAGEFDGSKVKINLGNLNAPQTVQVVFKVEVQ